MRTTLTIDDDVLQAAKALARAEGKTLGAVISELARHALRRRPSTFRPPRNGMPLLPVGETDTLVTLDIVNALRDGTR